MNKTVMLIAEKGSFMVNAIASGLKKEGYDVIPCEADVTALGRFESLPKLLVLYLDEAICAQTDVMIYLKDQIIEKELELYLVGNQEELEESLKLLTISAVAGKLERPLNVKDLAAVLDKAVERGNKAEEKKKILVVDDDPTMLRMIKNLLSAKYHVFMANSGMNAITFLAKNNVDLILLDYEMPVVSGAKVLEMIRSESTTADIPVMFLTAKSDRESVMNVLALKPVKYLLKNMPPEEWLVNIDEFFGK
ncbi:MAG: response regulator [Lachnospiraceae bacterium]|nr:response regulator [Lachnospiraceae bacterium]